MKEKQRQAIAEHGRKLLLIYPEATEPDPVKLCRKLHALEARARAVALRLCNGPEYPGGEDAVDAITDAIHAKVASLLGPGPAFFVNRDPRGHALKIHAAESLRLPAGFPKDWGGYGILCPEITEKGA